MNVGILYRLCLWVHLVSYIGLRDTRHSTQGKLTALWIFTISRYDMPASPLRISKHAHLFIISMREIITDYAGAKSWNPTEKLVMLECPKMGNRLTGCWLGACIASSKCFSWSNKGFKLSSKQTYILLLLLPLLNLSDCSPCGIRCSLAPSYTHKVSNWAKKLYSLNKASASYYDPL